MTYLDSFLPEAQTVAQICEVSATIAFAKVPQRVHKGREVFGIRCLRPHS